MSGDRSSATIFRLMAERWERWETMTSVIQLGFEAAFEGAADRSGEY
jgi:hypothetical protein